MKYKLFYALLFSLTLMAGCDASSSEPTYGGLSIESFNHTPYNLDRFVITDKFGNSASGGSDLMPGTGEERLNCCFNLKGTDFTVEWYAYDKDEFLKDIFAPIREIHKVSRVNVAPTKHEGETSKSILGVHFYPDDHIEFEFRRDPSGTRILYADVWDWLSKTHGKLLDPEGERDSVVFSRTVSVAAGGWIKSDDTERYTIPEMIDAYRSIVPGEKGLNLQDHIQVFLRWLAVRNQSPAFRASITSQADGMKDAHRAMVQERNEAELAYQAERSRSPIDQRALGQALSPMHVAKNAERQSKHAAVSVLANPVVSVWERIGSEAAEQTRRLPQQAGLKESSSRIRKAGEDHALPYGVDMEQSARIIEAAMMRPETLALAQAWQDGASGKKPLPPQVMALFDLLARETMLASSYKHVLSSPLYFQMRARDTFGQSDFEEEAKQRAADERRAQRVDDLPKTGNARAGMNL